MHQEEPPINFAFCLHTKKKTIMDGKKTHIQATKSRINLHYKTKKRALKIAEQIKNFFLKNGNQIYKTTHMKTKKNKSATKGDAQNTFI